MAADALTQLVTANRAKGGRHSPLYRWMRARHDALAAALEADGASWPTIAAMLASSGLTDGAGKPPTPERARKCWHQVRKDVAAARAKTDARRKPPPALAPIVATTPLPSPALPDPLRPTGGQAAGVVAFASVASDTSAPATSATVEERLRAFRASLNEGKVRIPEPINPAKSRGKTDGET
jgi:hypothetical protein